MVLCCPFFGVKVSVTFHLMCVHIILVRFGLLSWRELLTRLTMLYVLFAF